MEGRVCVQAREKEKEMESIRSVKTKTSDLSNKIRTKLNLLIDAINNQKFGAQPKFGNWKLRESSNTRDA